MNKNIAIVGCGWLGLPLAKNLVNTGYTVHGSTTSKEKITQLTNLGINAFLISISEEKLIGNCADFLKNITTIIINIPPKLRGKHKENYVRKMQLLNEALAKSEIKNVLFISSTAVYGEVDGEVTEETVPKPSTTSGRQILTAETIFRTNANFNTTILRFGGLIGGKRHPVYMLSKRKELSNGSHPINLIHRKDCIRIIEAILTNNWWNELFNGVFPYHPKKQEYYTFQAKKRKMQTPDYKTNNNNKGKIVRSNRLINVKKHKLTTPI